MAYPSHRCFFSAVLSAAAVAALAGTAPAQQPAKPAVTWTDAGTLTIEGQGRSEHEAPWGRLPAAAEGKVRKRVWDLSRHSAGIAVRFVTDATSIHARWTVANSTLAMPHMAATGVSGVDLYARDGDGRWRWVAVGKPKAATTTVKLVDISGPAVRREFMLYLPLYNTTESLELGVPQGTSIEAGPRRPKGRRKPIVFYGTSITHGACASRPGTCHVARIGRQLDHPVVNLGFSGNGQMETEVAEFIPELDPAVVVIDCLPNLNAEQVGKRCGPLVRQLRAAMPEVPILLVEDRNYADNWLRAEHAERNRTNQGTLRREFEKLLDAGVPNLHYLPHDDLLGDDGDDTVDGSHPSDLGFARHADAFRPVLERLLDRR